MGSFFKDMAAGGEKLQAQFLGPTYNYAKQIKSPTELNMSSKGTLPQLSADIAGIINYTEVLVAGNSKAQRNFTGNPKTTKPLGNSFYLETGGQCTKPNGNLTKRYVFVNNIPTGSIPFISSATGGNLPEFRGLVPGTIENLGHMNPLALFGGFMQGTNPKCQQLSLKATAGGSHKYVANADISNLDACLFANGKTSGTNPIGKGTKQENTKTGCAVGFKNMNDIMHGLKDRFGEDIVGLEKNPLANLYNLGFSTFLIYLMYRLIQKSR